MEKFIDKYNSNNSNDRVYDSNYNPTKEDIQKRFPDLQNGPSSLIQGSEVSIQQVHYNFKLPLKFKTKSGEDLTLETKVTGTVLS